MSLEPVGAVPVSGPPYEMNPIDRYTEAVISSAIKIHKGLGPGLLESAYELLLSQSLRAQGLHVLRQQPVSFTFNNIEFGNAFRADLIVEHVLLVEIKAVEILKPVHSKQLLTYLRLLRFEVGLLVNFGGETIRQGLCRVVNDYNPDLAGARGLLSRMPAASPPE